MVTITKINEETLLNEEMNEEMNMHLWKIQRANWKKGAEGSMKLTTPSKKRTEPRDDSPKSVERFWAIDANVESADDDEHDDGFCTVIGKVSVSARKAEKKRRLSEVTLDSLRKTSWQALPKTLRKAGLSEESRTE